MLEYWYKAFCKQINKSSTLLYESGLELNKDLDAIGMQHEEKNMQYTQKFKVMWSDKKIFEVAWSGVK